MMDVLIKGKDLAQQLFDEIIGLKPTRAKLGYGTMITLDFGRDVPKKIRTGKGVEIFYRSEWHLWVYLCDWRIDKDGNPLVGCGDTREKISQCMFELENRAVTEILVLNDAFDVRFRFGDNIDLYLFSNYTDEDEQWIFYIPNGKAFTSGPGTSWEYKDSGSTETNE